MLSALNVSLAQNRWLKPSFVSSVLFRADGPNNPENRERDCQGEGEEGKGRQGKSGAKVRLAPQGVVGSLPGRRGQPNLYWG